MKFTILGSGGSIPTPRPFSQSEVSVLARKDPTYKRNSSSLYLEDINMIVDTPEDITESINRENIETIDYVVFTHRHPDHTFGMRNVFNSFFDPIAQKPTKIVTILCPERVYEDIKQHFPSIDFFINVQKTAQIQFLNHNESIEINNMKITALGYGGTNASTYGYIFESNNKKLVYTPCDTIHLHDIPKNIDTWITECGIFSYEEVQGEMSFPRMIENIRESGSARTIITHIEEAELARRGLDYFQKMKNKYADVPFDLGYDGMKIVT